MKMKLLMGAGLLLSSGLAKAQWQSQTDWKYGFGNAKASTLTASTENTEYISKGSSSVLPSPSAGTAKLFLPPNTNAGFTVDPASNALVLKGSTSGASKFSVYGIDNASAVASISFITSFSNPDKQQATYFFSLGTKGKAGNLYNSANAVYTGANSNGALFNAVRFLYGNDGVTVGTRTEGNTTGVYATLTGGKLVFDTPYKIEVYANNSSEAKKYSRDGKEYAVAASSYNLWITNLADKKVAQYTLNGSPDLASSKETNAGTSTDVSIPVNSPLNSFLVQSINSKENTSSIKVTGDINIAYNK